MTDFDDFTRKNSIFVRHGLPTWAVGSIKFFEFHSRETFARRNIHIRTLSALRTPFKKKTNAFRTPEDRLGLEEKGPAVAACDDVW